MSKKPVWYDTIQFNVAWKWKAESGQLNLARVIRNKNIQKKTIKTNTSNFNIGKSRITRRQLHSVILPSRPGVNGWKMIQLTTLRRELVSASNPFVSYQSSRVSLSPYDLCRLLRHRNAHWNDIRRWSHGGWHMSTLLVLPASATVFTGSRCTRPPGGTEMAPCRTPILHN